MGLDIPPKDLEAVRTVWPIAGPLIRGTLNSFKESFEKRPTEVFTGANVALIAELVLKELEKAIAMDEEDNGHQEDNHGA